jgi:hypothetical protein
MKTVEQKETYMVEAAVKWINYRDREEPALVVQCEKFYNAIVMDFPIQVYTLDQKTAEKSRPVLYKGQPYPVDRNIKRFLEDSSFHGITPGARRIMMQLLEGHSKIVDCKPSENQVSETSARKAQALTPATMIEDDMDPPHVPKRPIRAAPTGRTLYETPNRGDDSDPAPSTPRNGSRKAGSGTKRGTVVQQLAAQLGIDAADVRKRLRQAKMGKPYEDFDKCLTAIKP